MDFSPKEREAMGGVPSTKVVGKGLESPPNLLPCKFGNTVRRARACCVWQGFMALVEWWLEEEKKNIMSRRCASWGLRIREKFGPRFMR